MGFGSIAAIFIVLLLAAGIAVAFYKRYSQGWQCGARDVWIICEEWRRKLAWIWAPREEKVGLVKAQHPTPQAVPGLYRQSSSNSSQYIMHSDSDLRLDAQGGFTRFEAVDRDLHPLSEVVASQKQQNASSLELTAAAATATTTTMPQVPVPASQMDDIPPQPLRPAPQPRTVARPRPSPLRADYLRQIRAECEPSPLTPPPPPPPPANHSKYPRASSAVFLFGQDVPPPIPPPPSVSRTLSRDNFDPGLLFNSSRIDPFEESRKMRYGVKGPAMSEPLFDSKDMDLVNDASPPYGSYDMINEARNNFDFFASQMHSESQNYGMGIRRTTSSRNLQDLERITRYIQSLPDVPVQPSSPSSGFYERNPGDESDDEDEGVMGAASQVAPPPPAPPDPAKMDSSKQTTGEKIFQALRAVTSQSYIDASEFYNSIMSSTQNMTFPSSNVVQTNGLENPQHESRAIFTFGLNDIPPRRTSDLFSTELNDEAKRTAQEVYNSLQDPPASPLLLKDADQQAYSYLSTDPSFTRTSEDIFNSLEHRRKSVQERLNGFQEMLEYESNEDARARRNSQEMISALEEASLNRRLSQIFDEIANEEDEQLLVNGSVSRRNSLSSLHNGSMDDFASLQRAISCESVCSDTSVILNDFEAELNTEDAPVTGLVCVGLEHDRWPCYVGESDLNISVLEARDLIAGDGRPAVNTYARVCLLPERANFATTRLYKGTSCPSYQEKFCFGLVEDLANKALLCEIFSHDLEQNESNLLGLATLRLGPVPRPPMTTWLPLVIPPEPVPLHGELMFSLSYLPTAERLTLVVVKARNLVGANEMEPGDFFVKVYLLQQGKKQHKKRTSIKRGEKSPIFNEAIIFNVPAHSLQSVQLRLTVAEVNGDLALGSKPVGHVIVGASTSGRPLTHWRQMLTNLRKPVAMWHPLRK